MRSIRWMISLAALGLALASSAHAQEPDVRDIPPFVMLVVDSSGSMEDLPACTCTSPTDCSNCAPKCSLMNVSGEPPKDSSGHELKKNRWAVTLEALTGKFVDFQCTDVARTALNGMTYDENYAIPYHQPWKCSSGTVCPYPTTSGFQQADGILDSYIETLRFGLMTFDGEYTYKGGSDLLTEAAFNDTLSKTMPGMWSLGGKQSFKYPGCDDTYYVDSGARSEDATEGTLISLDSTKCASAPCDIYELNASIQDALLKTRPYGGTPIAASLTDLYDHLKNGVTDKFKECRKRYAILITDGAPDPDFRDLRCDCENENPLVACPAPYTGKGKDLGFACPYQPAEVVAKKLVAGEGTLNPAQIEKLFVLGMSVQDVEAQKILDKIADAGGTKKALQADDPSTLRATLDGVFSPLLNPISRSVPGFATGLGGTQYQISTGFQVSSKSLTATVAPPWAGLIERRSFVCNQSTGKIESPDLTDADRLHKAVNSQDKSKRKLWTVLPATTFKPEDLKGRIGRGGAGEMCGSTNCDLLDLRSTAVAPFISSDSTESPKVVSWMYGDDGSARDGRRLGDIYHSSPTIVGPPPDQAADDAYARFRETPVVKERPLVMYITTNDGVLRAISVEDYPVKDVTATVHEKDTLKAGEELWGFVPPILLGQLKDQLSSHQFNFDGTPVVKDVYFKRGTSSSEETEYRTVLITGMRGGGRGYVALDVTDPYVPKFLWQFADEKDMGNTYGQPEIVQATFKYTPPGGTTSSLQTRAVAILPGGKGTPKGATSTPNCILGNTLAFRHSSDGSQYASWRVDDVSAQKPAVHRPAVRCWERTGRSLYFVDVETGYPIKKIFDNDDDVTNGIMLPSPIVGTPTAYLNAVGTTADRGFVMDADGVMWRIDMSSQDVEEKEPTKGWTMRPFHDLFWDKKKAKLDSGETTYERPILTVDENRRLVVLIGTGDTDNFEKPGADNRIVSLTEVINTDPPTGPDSYQALINWELRNENGTDAMALQPTELVTGSMALFEGSLYAATFISNVGTDACEYGRGRLWSLSYKYADKSGEQNPKWDADSGATGDETLTFPPLLVPLNTPVGLDSDDEYFNIPVDRAIPNMLVQGLGTTQRPSCTKPDPDPLNSYFSPALANIQAIEPPTVWIVAQASGGSRRAGSGLGGLQAGAARGPTLSRVTSWATSVD